MNPIAALSRLFFPNRPAPTPQLRPPAPPTPRPASPDTVHLSGPAQDDDLGQILRHVAAAAEAAKRRSPAAHESAEAEIESLLADIAGAEGPGGSRNRQDLVYKVTDVAKEIAQHSVYAVRPPLGGGLDVNVEVLASAQPAGLFLSFGRANLDLADADARFTIRIGGREGGTELSFASGTSIQAIAAAINTVTGESGVRADGFGSRIKLHTGGFGSHEFVSVSVIDDGGIASRRAGVYRVQRQNAYRVDYTSRTPFSEADQIQDEGQDVRALVNGIEADGRGVTLRVRTEDFRAAITLHADAALRAGAFTAFRIVRGQ